MEQAPMRERAEEYTSSPNLVRNLVNEGCEQAREVARKTLEEVRQSMGLEYR